MYEKLKAIYNRDSGQRAQQLLQDFYGFICDKFKDIASNISSIQNIAFKLNRLQEEKLTDKMLISKILSVLPEKLNHFIPAWDSTRKEDKTINNLIARLIKGEGRLKSSNGESFAFKTIKKNKKTYKLCPVCKKTNHKEEDCFIKKKQENSDCNSEKDKNKKDKNKETKQNSPCSYCKKINHLEENCWFKPGGSSSSNSSKISRHQLLNAT